MRVARGDVVEIATPRSPTRQAATDPANATATFQAQALGGWGNDVQAQIRPMVGATMSILPSPTAGALAITALSQDVAADVAQVVVPEAAGTFDASIDGAAGRDRGTPLPGLQALRSTSRRPADLHDQPGNPQDQLHHLAWKTGLAVQRLRTAMLPDNTQLGVNGAQKLYAGAIVELDNGTQKEVHTVASVRRERGDVRLRPD